MTDKNDIFSGDNPFQIFKRWFNDASKTEINDHDAIALSTVDVGGLPNVRMVLLRGIEEKSFVFYTNYGSVKSQELSTNHLVAFVWHSKSLRRQIRVRGQVEKEDGEKADEYYRSRSLKSRIGAWASVQSQPLKSRSSLMEQVEYFEKELGEEPSRPSFWGGWRIQPLEIEFWADGDARLHDRFRWSRATLEEDWNIQRLNP
ncbi:MAG: pyridoxamine 5'-phosphate oxidase [Rhodobacteraceae bacterium TMED111]|nr:pyridoxamine 5'-phosphate oxidase [Marinovum sp.]OUV39199.1 MAG: pyridoxamine 5'-phosphate oxidase [Rhodobacteraceae bacterium TMED111]